MLKKLPLWAKIFIGMGLGILWGLISVWINLEDFTGNWVKPWGTIFLKLLKLIAVPLIFVSLVKGISSLTDITKLSRIGYKTIVIYIMTTVFATTVGLALVNILKPGDVFPDEKQEQYRQKFSGQIELKQESAQEIEKQSPLHFFEDMIPENFFHAAGDNSKMLQIIFFAILFSIALVLVPGGKTEVVKDFFDGLNDVILKIVDLIMRFRSHWSFRADGSPCGGLLRRCGYFHCTGNVYDYSDRWIVYPDPRIVPTPDEVVHPNPHKGFPQSDSSGAACGVHHQFQCSYPTSDIEAGDQ